MGREVGEGKGLDGVEEGASDGIVIISGYIEGEIYEGPSVGLYEGGESGVRLDSGVTSCSPTGN